MYPRADNPINPSPLEGADVFPFVWTTSRLTEHHTAGAMSRYVARLAELQPEMFVEVSPELAEERGLENAGWCTVVTSRSAIEGRVLVTDRLTPLRVDGRTVHQVWLPCHWGSGGIVTGDSANDLIGVSLDPNVLIQESKVGTCDVRAGRRPSGRALLDFVAGYRERAGVLDAHGARHHGGRRGRGREQRGLRGSTRRGEVMTGRNSLFGPLDPAADAGYDDHPPRKGFFTDTSICIGCKACEVACKEWNDVPADHFEMLARRTTTASRSTPTSGGTSRSSSSPSSSATRSPASASHRRRCPSSWACPRWARPA